MTLAYVFWHWNEGPAPAYAERLGAFHRALAAHPPRGFRSSRSFAVAGAEWLPRGGGFEEVWWFSKPRRTTYEAFLARLLPLAREPGAALWQRQMVLGPAPEFCLRSPRGAEPPSELQALAVACRPV